MRESNPVFMPDFTGPIAEQLKGVCGNLILGQMAH